jgi:hypothetical protein
MQSAATRRRPKQRALCAYIVSAYIHNADRISITMSLYMFTISQQHHAAPTASIQWRELWSHDSHIYLNLFSSRKLYQHPSLPRLPSTHVLDNTRKQPKKPQAFKNTFLQVFQQQLCVSSESSLAPAPNIPKPPLLLSPSTLSANLTQTFIRLRGPDVWPK